MAIGLACAFLAAAAYGIGTVAQSVGVHRIAGAATDSDVGHVSLGHRLWRGRAYFAGLGLDVVGFVASIVALRDLPLFLVESAVASSVGVTAIVAFLVQGVRLSRSAAVALGIMLAGLVLLSVTAEPGAGRVPSNGFAWTLLASAVLLAAVVGATILSTGRGWSTRHVGVVLAVASGLGFGLVGIVTRVIVVPSPWWHVAGGPLLWALLVAGAAALIACGYALDQASATGVSALIVVSETIVPAAVGLALLGDVVRPHLETFAAGGFVATLGGCLGLARLTSTNEVFTS